MSLTCGCPSRLSSQSDGAGNYQNLCLPLLLPELADAVGLTVTRILHTEAQDGKCIVDGHFQKVGWAIRDYVLGTQGKCMTAREVCDALEYDGGIP